MRGKVRPKEGAGAKERITPAHAGKSITNVGTRIGAADHPRPCGEKPAPDARRSAHIGSPPPMRGKVRPKEGAGAKERITPAHAGKSITNVGTRIGAADHPRPCGEKPAPDARRSAH